MDVRLEDLLSSKARSGGVEITVLDGRSLLELGEGVKVSLRDEATVGPILRNHISADRTALEELEAILFHLQSDNNKSISCLYAL